MNDNFENLCACETCGGEACNCGCQGAATDTACACDANCACGVGCNCEGCRGKAE